jgi:pimeloyl-ACP methyl ester carboxylesterase
MSSQLVHRFHHGAPTLHYVEGPRAGPALLLLHGVTRNWRDWEPLLPELMREWHVFALDHRGHGRSGRAGDGYLVADYCHDAAAFVRATFSEPVTVAGHSLGAMVALSLAAECGPHISAVVLEDPPFHTMGRDIGATPYRAQFAGMQEAARRGGGVTAITGSLAETCLPSAQGPVRLGDVRDRASLEFSAECLTELDPEVLTPLIEARWLDGYEAAELWPRVACPALLLQGDPGAGGAFTDEDSFAARRAVATHQHRRFDGVGHQIHRTCPAEFLAALRAFLQCCVAWLVFLAGASATPAAEVQPESGGPFVQFVETGREAVPYGHPYAVQMVGDRAYVANGEGGLVILAIAAAGPKVLGRFITGTLGRDAIDRDWIHEYRGRATAIAVSGKFVFLLTQSKGYDINRPKILRFDVSNPAQPSPAGECLLDRPVSDIVALDASHVCMVGGMSASLPAG